MNLIELVDNSLTDKNTCHSYLPLYDKLLYSRKYTAKNVLELGIFKGGSIKLWKDYFTQAVIYGVDIESNIIIEEIKNLENVILLTEVNGYSDTFINEAFIKKNIEFDLILDDGPHTLESMIYFVENYSKLLSNDGILIIEDIRYNNWFDELIKHVPNDLKQYVSFYDLTDIKNRFDDRVFVIDKKINL